MIRVKESKGRTKGALSEFSSGACWGSKGPFLAFEENGTENWRMRIKKTGCERKDGYWIGVGDLSWVAGAQQRPT